MFVLAGRGVVSRLRGARWGEGQSTFSGNAAENEIITMQSTSPLPSPSGWLLSLSRFTSISSHFDLSPLLFSPFFSLLLPPGFSPTLSPLPCLPVLVCVCLHQSLTRDQPGGWMSRTLCCLSPRDNPIKLRNLIMDYLTCSHTHIHTDLHTCMHI